jgi:hypothetical protein
VRAASSEHENRVWTQIARLMYLVCVRLLELLYCRRMQATFRYAADRRSCTHATRASAAREEKLAPHWRSVKQHCAKE